MQKKKIQALILGLIISLYLSVGTIAASTTTITNVSSATSSITNITKEQYPFSHLLINDTVSSVLYMPFDLNSSADTRTYDYSLNSNDGFIRNNASASWQTNGNIGGAYQFDGVNDYINLGNGTNLGMTSFTLMAWIYRTGTGVTASSGSGGLTAVEPVIAKGRSEADGTNQDTNYLFGYDATGGRIAADFESTESTNNNYPIYGQKINNNTWVHVVVTYNGSQWNIYTNGTLFNTSNPGKTPRSDSVQNRTIATACDSTGTCLGAFRGFIDEVMIYNRSLSATEIANIYNNQTYRFLETGRQTFENINITQDGTFDTLNITTNSTALHNSYINLTIRELNWAGINTNNISRIIPSGKNQIVIVPISIGTENITMDFDFIAGNSSTSFISPTLENNIIINAWDSNYLWDCGTLNNEDGIYILMQNVSSSGTCFTVTESGVILHGNGYNVIYAVSEYGSTGIDIENIGFKVNNLGIFESAGDFGQRGMLIVYGSARISNVIMEQFNGNSIAISGGIDGIIIENSNITTHGGYGIYLAAASTNLTVVNSRIQTDAENGNGIYCDENTNFCNITNCNITIRGSGIGIYIFESGNAFINGVNLTGYIDYSRGIYISGGINATVNNVFAATIGNYADAIDISIDNVIVSNATAITTGNSRAFITNGNNITFYNVNAKTYSATNAYGIRIFGGNLTVNDSIINATNDYDVYIDSGNNFNFTNTSFNDWLYDFDGGQLNVFWYLNTIVNFTNGTLMQGANITIYDKNNVSVMTQLTGSDGSIARFPIRQFRQNGTASNNITFYSNYTFFATQPDGMVSENQSWNMTTNRNLIFTFNQISYPQIIFNSKTKANATLWPLNWIFIDGKIFMNASNLSYIMFWLMNINTSVQTKVVTKWHTAFILPYYLAIQNATDLSLDTDTSSMTYNPQNNTLFVIHNNDCDIDELHLNGTLIRKIVLTNFLDCEGIGYLNTTGNNQFFALVEEGIANISVFNISFSATAVNKNNVHVYDTGLPNLANTGLEGVVFDHARNVFYMNKEKTTMEIYQYNVTSGTTTILFNATITFNGTQKAGDNASCLFTDTSDLYYDNNTDTLFVESQESLRICQISLQGNISYNYSIAYSLNTEGITFDPYGDYMYLAGEPDYFSVLKTINFTTLHNFTGLASGTYRYNITINNTEGYENATETRTITLDTTPPVVTIIEPINFTIKSDAFNFTFYDANTGVVCAMYSLNGGANATNCSLINNGWSGTFAAVGDGTNFVIVYANDSAGNYGGAVVYWTKHTAPPIITVISPINTSYNTSVTWFNITTNETAYCNYSLGIANISMSTVDNLIFYGINNSMLNGVFMVIFYCMDIMDNINSTSIVFTVNVSAPLSLNFTYPTANDSEFSTRRYLYVNATSSSSFSACTLSYFDEDFWHNVSMDVYGNYCYTRIHICTGYYRYYVTGYTSPSQYNFTETRTISEVGDIPKCVYDYFWQAGAVI